MHAEIFEREAIWVLHLPVTLTNLLCLWKKVWFLASIKSAAAVMSVV